LEASTDWQWCGVNEYCGMSAAQPMRRRGLTITSLPLDPKHEYEEELQAAKTEVWRYS
jgi:hypothetical protein